MRAVLLVLLVACGHATPAPVAPPAPAAPTPGVVDPIELPQYPGAMDAGVSGGPEPVAMLIAGDPVDQVRAFYARQTYAGFEVQTGDLTEASPLCATDRAAKLRRCIWVVDDKGTAMIHIRTTPAS